jgi:hypothetical protein
MYFRRCVRSKTLLILHIFRILEKGISKQLFMVQAQEVSELAECFGLFKYFYNMVVERVEKAVRCNVILCNSE